MTSRLAREPEIEPFKRLAQPLRNHVSGVVRGMFGGRSNAYVQAMKGLLQQTKVTPRGFRYVGNSFAVAYLRMFKHKRPPDNPLVPATPRAVDHWQQIC